jgi:hypothetical protein
MVGGLLWAALSFVFLLMSYEIDTSLGLRYPTSLFWLLNSVSYNYLLQILALLLFIVALLGLYQDGHIRASHLARLGFVLSLLWLSLIILLPPLAVWLNYGWLNSNIANLLTEGCIDTSRGRSYYDTGIGFNLLPIGLILLAISYLRTKALPTIAMLGLSVSSFALLLPTIVGVALYFGMVAFHLPYEFMYKFDDVLHGYGLSPIIDYLFGISWIGLGYALHCKANQRQSITQT